MVTRVTIATVAVVIGTGAASGTARARPDCSATPSNISRPASCVVPTDMSEDVPKPIPDLLSVSSVLEFPVNAVIQSISLVGLSITHPWIGDLRVTLTSPGGTTVVLIDQVCNLPPGAANFSNIELTDYDGFQPIGSVCPPAANGRYRPSNPLSAFQGEAANGTWTLTVSDLQLFNTGTLESWGIRFFLVCTRVEIASLSVTRERTSTVVRWRTASELGVADFNVYREQAGRRVRMNRALIPARGTNGHGYVFRDRLRPTGSSRYWLETVHFDGSRTRHGPAKLR